MDTASTHPVEALLFDLGGVLIEIDFDRTFRAWEALSPLSLDEIRARFYFDDAYEQHERGEIDRIAYFAHLRALLHLEATDHEIAVGWNALFIRDIPAVLAAIKGISARIPCYAFTNTNAEHQRAWSWELGLRKPEHAAFRAVADAIGVSYTSILFFDDTLENVEHAQALGVQTVHVRSPIDVENALARLC